MRKLCAAASAFLLLIACLYACIASFAFTPDVYSQQPPFDRMAQETAAYLRGSRDELSESLFGLQERLHMADVRNLFRLGRCVAIVSGALCALGLALGRREGRSFLLGVAAFVAVLGAAAIWAAADFTGWFTAMHRLAFSNDLWLFDPSSPLIQMMPETFFISAVKQIGGRLFLCVCGAALLGLTLCKRKKT